LGQGIFWQTVCQSRLAIGKAICGNLHAIYQQALGVSLVGNVLGTEMHSEGHFQKCWVQ